MTELEVKAMGTVRSHAVECWTQPGSIDLLRDKTHDKIKWTVGTGEQVQVQQLYQSTASVSPCGPQALFQDSQKFFWMSPLNSLLSVPRVRGPVRSCL